MSNLDLKKLAHHQTPLLALKHPLFEQHQIEVWIKRDDLTHPDLQGNKFHKLKLNLTTAAEQGKNCLITFGGAYSNHIAATAAAGKILGFKTIGYIRGEELEHQPQNWSHTLMQAHKNGMSLKFLSRAAYRNKETPGAIETLMKQFPNAYLLPEGGTNILAVQGFKAVCEDLETQCPNWTHLYSAVGTGGTLAGFIRYAQPHPNRHIYGVATLKDSDYLSHSIETLLQENGSLVGSKTSVLRPNWAVLKDYHGGGYAKSTPEMLKAQTWFEQTFTLLLDPIYTQKMVFAFLSELKKYQLPAHAKVILYHSGGLQGRPLPHDE